MTLQAMSFIFGAILLAVAILGGGFEVKELKVSNVTLGVRIIAGIVGLIFVVLGFWSPGPLPGAISSIVPTETAPTVKMSEREDGKDRWGGDYLYFDVSTDHIEDCEAACKADAKCSAWTYVKPAVLKPRAVCCLKNVVPAISENSCCVSGTKIR